jgi:hypothetical protein
MRNGDFFVGYLETPAGMKRFLRGVVVGFVGVVVGLTAILASVQRDPGEGVWHVDESSMIEGVAFADPCPVIRVKEGDVEKTLLLVSEGKFGARQRISALDGKRVRVRGHRLSGRGVPMLELEDGAEAIKVAEPAADSGGENVRWGENVVIRGELVDPKCFSGAMKPGEGKTHKSCAALCIRGGMPVMFVAVEDGKTVPYLVVESSGKSLNGERLERILPFVGDWAEVRGRVGTWADLKVLDISADGIRRL